jgi:hypothetical protein
MDDTYCKYHKTHNHGWTHCRKKPAVQNSNPSGSRSRGNEESHQMEEIHENPEENSGIIHDKEEDSDEEFYNMDAVEGEEEEKEADPVSLFDSQSSLMSQTHRNLQRIVESRGIAPDKAEDFVPEVLSLVYKSIASRLEKPFCTLVDSGTSTSILVEDSLPHALRACCKPDPKGSRTWHTKAGTFRTSKTVTLAFCLRQFRPRRTITHSFKVDSNPSKNPPKYPIIMGRDLCLKLGLALSFNTTPPAITWDDMIVPMSHQGSWTQDKIAFHHLLTIDQAVADFDEKVRLKPAEYHKGSLDDCIPAHLTHPQSVKLRNLLKKHQSLFQGKLGTMPGDPYLIEMHVSAKPYRAKAFSVPVSMEPLMKAEVQHLVNLGVLMKVNFSEWAAPSSGVPKANGEIRFVTDFRFVNKFVVRHPYPTTLIPQILRTQQGFTFVTVLDVNMGFWTIPLVVPSQKVCTTILPWGKYAYKHLPMGLA